MKNLNFLNFFHLPIFRPDRSIQKKKFPTFYGDLNSQLSYHYQNQKKWIYYINP